jgi:putative phage-type endonuclease
MKTHNLIQGTPEWHAYRANHFNASDAPAMMGVSPYETRSQLIHRLATGEVREVDAATQRRFDDGHRFEAMARTLAEKIIGEDLYPVTGSEGKYSASFDGLTMTEDTSWEHKSLNDSLRACMRQQGGSANDFLPPLYRVQLEQQQLVSGAERTLFMASKWDGDELVEERHCWYSPDAELRAQIIAGWEQLAEDIAAYVPPEVIVPAVATPQMGLPAVAIQVTGSIALVDNLDKFGAALSSYVERINKKPESDQDFADLEATVKTLKAAEEALDAAENSALAQTASIDTMRKTVALYRDTARTNRLLVEKLVKAEKENRRTAIIGDAAAELVTHIRKLNERLGKPYMPSIAADFQGVVKGLKSLDSMKDKVSSELARCKISANESADRIQANLATLRELASEYTFLFADAPQLVQKANDDLTALVKSRISDHKTAEAAKEEATRERIRLEEQAKAEKEVAENLRAATPAPTLATQASAEVAKGQIYKGHRYLGGDPSDRNSWEAVSVTHEAVVSMMPPAVRKAMDPNAEPTLKLGEISTRLGFTVTADFLHVLGFSPAKTDRASKLFHEAEFPQICQALIAHIGEVSEQFDAVAA